MSPGECFLCLRTSPQRILEVSHKLFSDSELAHKVGMKAAGLLREAYLKDPPALCGKKTNALIAGALYVASLLEDEWTTQREVAEACNVTETSVRYNYQCLARLLNVKLPEWLKKHWRHSAETYRKALELNRQGTKVKDISDQLDMPRTTAYAWVHGMSKPLSVARVKKGVQRR